MTTKRIINLGCAAIVAFAGYWMLENLGEIRFTDMYYFGIALLLGSMFLFGNKGFLISLIAILYGFAILYWEFAFRTNSENLITAGNILWPAATAVMFLSINEIFSYSWFDAKAEDFIRFMIRRISFLAARIMCWAVLVILGAFAFWQFADTTIELGWQFWGIQAMCIELEIALVYIMWIAKPVLYGPVPDLSEI